MENSCRHLQTYSFLPHRNTVVERFDGVTFVDDSKATNVHATLSALKCYANTPVALIVGGFDKGENFDRLFDGVSPNVKVVCAVGQTAEKNLQLWKKTLLQRENLQRLPPGGKNFVTEQCCLRAERC